MRQLDDIFWGREDGKELRVGFTPNGLASFGQIWQFIPRLQIGETVQYGQAIATIESTTALRSLCIPVEGRLTWINPEILTAPELVSDKMDIFAFQKAAHALSGL